MHERTNFCLNDRFLLRRAPSQVDQRYLCPPWRHTQIPVELFDLMTLVKCFLVSPFFHYYLFFKCPTDDVCSSLSSSLWNLTILSIYDSKWSWTCLTTTSCQSHNPYYSSISSGCYCTIFFSLQIKIKTKCNCCFFFKVDVYGSYKTGLYLPVRFVKSIVLWIDFK